MDRPAIDTLRDIRNGDLMSEFDDALAEVVQACQDLGKMGTISLSIKVKPDLSMGIMVLEDDLKFNAPKEICATMFHVTPELNLSLRNPRQPDLPNLEAVAEKAVKDTLEEVSNG